MKVGFACVTGYHIFISYLLAKSLYKKDEKVIFLSDLMKGSKEIYTRLNESKVFEEVYFIEEKDLGTRLKNAIYIRRVFKSINYKDIKILHVFSWGRIYSSFLANKINKTAKIILTEEGLATCFLTDKFLSVKDKIRDILFKDNLDFRGISGIYLFNKKLYSGSDLYRPLITDIDIKPYFKDLNFLEQTKQDLDLIFDYDNKLEIDNNIIFFDQNIDTFLNQEKFIKLFSKNIRTSNIQVKLHPLHSKDHYAKQNFQTLNTSIPWEVIYLNKNKRQFTYITYYSSAVFNNKMIFGTNDKIILLYDILNNYKEVLELDIENFNKSVLLIRKYVSNFKQNYPEAEICVPKDFKELKELLNRRGEIYV